MNLSGVSGFNQPVEQIWQALHDPDMLKLAIPGCQSLTLTDEGYYHVVMKLGVAAVKGEYTGKVKIEDIEYPNHYILHAEGSGTPGHVKAIMDCRLYADGQGSKLDWTCEAEIGGMIASVGQRVISGLAKFMSAKFFKDIEAAFVSVTKP